MNVETNLVYIEQQAQDRSDSNGAFRSFLKFGTLSPHAIDRTVHRLYEEVSGRIDCMACANCCKVARPVLGPTDIKRLSARKGMPDGDFRERYLKKDEEGPG